MRKSFQGILAIALGAAFASAAFSGEAAAAALQVAHVVAPKINCIFNTGCTLTVYDTVGNFVAPGDAGTARLQSRYSRPDPGAPGAGLIPYFYRLDLTMATGNVCATSLTIDFSQPQKLDYSSAGAVGSADVYVVTTGGLGSVAPSGAVQIGKKIEFDFATPVCPGQTSFFFGLASKNPPQPGQATIAFGDASVTTNDQAP